MRAIIVDDEARSREALASKLGKNHSEIKIIASGTCVQEGIDLVRRYEPEVVFLDIEMPDGLGFDLLKAFDDPQFHVVFTTAHNEYAITAIRFGAFDYLLKPIDDEELAQSIKRLNRQLKEQITSDQIQILLDTLSNYELKKLPTRIALSTSDGILYKLVEDIVRLEACQTYTEFSIANESKKIITSHNLGEYVEPFERYREFMKVHRSHLVNLYFVDRYVRTDGGFLVMKDGAQVSVSRAYRDELLQRLENL